MRKFNKLICGTDYLCGTNAEIVFPDYQSVFGGAENGKTDNKFFKFFGKW